MKIGIVGCGKIADSHAWAIQHIADCEIVGVCDRERLMAKQLYERFPIKAYFDDLSTLLDRTKPDVVHITTPPQSHFALAKECLERGCNVYIEKPFTCDTAEAEELIAVAQRQRLKLTAGHDDQFRHCARRMRELVQSGYLGIGPLHMESYYGYDMGAAGYAKALLSDKGHWARALPGGLLQNIISHGIARIAEFMTTDKPLVLAHGFVSPLLQSLGEHDIVDELRVIVSESRGNTAYFTFSSQLRPSLHQLRILGAKNGLLIDLDNETLIRLPGVRRKSYLEQFLPPIEFAGQYLRNLMTNSRLFLTRDFHSKAGMKYLIEAFYRSIREDSPNPIAYREILVTSRIMDAIFDQLRASRHAKPTSPSESPPVT